MKTSAVWIEGGQLYRFQQVMNPGPSILVPWDMGLDKMKDRVREIRRIQLELARVIAVEDSAARAEGLKVYVRSDVREAQQLALSELGKSGRRALATIREMLSDPAFADDGAELVKAFAEARGESVGEELDRRTRTTGILASYWTDPIFRVVESGPDSPCASTRPVRADVGASSCAETRALPTCFNHSRAA